MQKLKEDNESLWKETVLSFRVTWFDLYGVTFWFWCQCLCSLFGVHVCIYYGGLV